MPVGPISHIIEVPAGSTRLQLTRFLGEKRVVTDLGELSSFPTTPRPNWLTRIIRPLIDRIRYNCT